MILFRKAILIIHGFTGGIYDNEYLMNYLEYDPFYDVYAKTLPGHDLDRYKDTKYTEWINFVEFEVENLINHGYQEIYVVGHSMGGILASIVASKYKQIKKLVLVNAAFEVLNLEQNKKDLLENKDFSKYKGLIEKFIRISPGFIVELKKIVKNNHEVIRDVNCDVLILQSEEDEIVPKTSAEYIYNTVGSKNKYLTYLKGCSHVVLHGNRKEEVSKYIKVFLKGGLKWKKVMTREL